MKIYQIYVIGWSGLLSPFKQLTDMIGKETMCYLQERICFIAS